MAIDKIVKEYEVNFDEFAWIHESGVTTGVFQDQGLDIILYQKKEKTENFMRCYSEPGFALFASLLNYHKHMHESLPPLEEIQHLLGMINTHYGKRSYPEFAFLKELIDMKIPELKGNQAIHSNNANLLLTGADMGGLMYCGFLEGDNLVIAKSLSINESEFDVGVMVENKFERTYDANWEKIIFLQPDDALQIMKCVYYHADDNKLLDKLYDHAKRKK